LTMRFFAALLFMPILGAVAMPALFVPRDDEPLSSAGVCKDEHTCLSNGKEYSCKVFVSYSYQLDCSVCACTDFHIYRLARLNAKGAIGLVWT